MGIFDRLAKGWKLALLSFDIIKRNKGLLLFPVFSLISIVLIFMSFVSGLIIFGSNDRFSTMSGLFCLIVFYFVNSAVVIFFNMALIHCTFKILNGEQADVKDGINFSYSRINLVLSWALVSATVGVILKAIEEKHEMLTNIIIGIFGMLWSLATFLVIPVMAYENLGVIEAVKRSSFLFKSAWGEQVGANFSFDIITYAVFFVMAIILGVLIIPFSVPLFIILLILMGSVIGCVVSAAETVFLAAAYQYSAGIPVKGFDENEFKGIFIPRA